MSSPSTRDRITHYQGEDPASNGHPLETTRGAASTVTRSQGEVQSSAQRLLPRRSLPLALLWDHRGIRRRKCGTARTDILAAVNRLDRDEFTSMDVLGQKEGSGFRASCSDTPPRRLSHASTPQRRPRRPRQWVGIIEAGIHEGSELLGARPASVKQPPGGGQGRGGPHD